MVCIGYAGIEAFDVVLYIGCTLTKLNTKVLIIDLSDTGAMTKAIKHGMDLDSRVEIVNYRDINYTRRVPAAEELSLFSEGVVIVVYGWNYIDSFPLELDSLTIVINTFPNVIEKISNIIRRTVQRENFIKLLIRDIVMLDDVELVKSHFSLPVKFTDISYLYLDIEDYYSAVKCQLTQVIRFTKITARMEKYIVRQIIDMLPKLKTSNIRKAVSLARKGGSRYV